MKTNPMLDEIRETRDRLAEQAGEDLRKLFALVHERALANRQGGERVVPEPDRAAVVREDGDGYRTSEKE